MGPSAAAASAPSWSIEEGDAVAESSASSASSENKQEEESFLTGGAAVSWEQATTPVASRWSQMSQGARWGNLRPGSSSTPVQPTVTESPTAAWADPPPPPSSTRRQQLEAPLITGGEKRAKWLPVVRVVKALCIVSSVGAIFGGVFGMWSSFRKNFDAVMALVSFYVALFNVTLLLAEVDCGFFFRKFAFLASRMGRAATHCFIGSLAFVQGVDFRRRYDTHWCLRLLGVCQMAAGFLLALSYCCVGSGDAGVYNDARRRQNAT